MVLKMGRLIDGKWTETSIVTATENGSFDRLPRTFLDTITKNHPQFIPETNRYHLIVSHACPWAQRTLIYRQLKNLTDHISVSVVHPDMLNSGWTFEADKDGATGDPLYNHQFLYQFYQQADSNVTTSVTVPLLWDKKNETIVNNESSEIIRIFNTNFNELTGNDLDFYPEDLQKEIDELNNLIYENINNGVYKCGFAQTQDSYDEACFHLFKTLDQLETILNNKKFLTGDTLTEADIRLIPTLLRFDLVYVTHFKCNVRRIIDYPNLRRYTKELYELPAIEKTTNINHIKRHYYFSHEHINPYRIIPTGPQEFL